jgi:hypothetical protein
MTKLTKLAAVAVAALALTQTVQANQINGNIGFTGTVTYNSASPGTATQVTSWINPYVTGASGDFASIPVNTPVAFPSGAWSFNSGAVSPFWTISVGNFIFSLTSSSILSQGPGFVFVSGTGNVTGTGFDSTPMSWSFTSQDPAADKNIPSWTFSTSGATTVPDGGATVMLLGLALSGVALLKKKLTA